MGRAGFWEAPPPPPVLSPGLGLNSSISILAKLGENSHTLPRNPRTATIDRGEAWPIPQPSDSSVPVGVRGCVRQRRSFCFSRWSFEIAAPAVVNARARRQRRELTDLVFFFATGSLFIHRSVDWMWPVTWRSDPLSRTTTLPPIALPIFPNILMSFFPD